MTPTRRPVVVLVRPTGVDTDSRVKKIALSLDRIGYDVTILGRSETTKRREGHLGNVRVVLVPPRTRLKGAPQRIVRLPVRRLRGVEKQLNAWAQRAEREADQRIRKVETKGAYLFHAAQRDFRTTYGSELVKIAPDVIHVHDPRLLPVAFRAAERIKARSGHGCEVVYDARENFAGVLETNEALPEYHKRVLAAETKYGRQAAAILTVSDAVAEALSQRISPTSAPAVLLNTPVQRDLSDLVGERRSLRADAHIPDGDKVLVYPGAASKARGVDTIVEALPHLPGWHAVLVVVPYPHPREVELRDAARELGVEDRLHLVPPVPADDVPAYLSEADVAVHPMLAGIPNHEMAMPNKLFEIMHARRPMASSHVKTMSAFVRDHAMGEVFQSGDPHDLARVVLKLDADARAGHPAVATDDVVHRYSWQGQEAKLRSAYARAAAPAPRSEADDRFPPAVVEWTTP